jgi:hypothetical protein
MKKIGEVLVLIYMWFVGITITISFLERWYFEYTHPINGLGFDIAGIFFLYYYLTMPIPILLVLFSFTGVKGKYKESLSYFSVKFFVIPFILLLILGYGGFKGFLIYSEKKAYTIAKEMNVTVREETDSHLPLVKKITISTKNECYRWSYHLGKYVLMEP